MDIKEKDEDETPGWSHIILEGFCMRHVNPEPPLGKYLYEVTSEGELMEIPNPKWNGKEDDWTPPDKPEYCKNRVCNGCFENDCPYLATCSPDENDLKEILKWIDELYKTMEEKL